MLPTAVIQIIKVIIYSNYGTTFIQSKVVLNWEKCFEFIVILFLLKHLMLSLLKHANVIHRIKWARVCFHNSTGFKHSCYVQWVLCSFFWNSLKSCNEKCSLEVKKNIWKTFLIILLKKNLTPKNSNRPLLISIFHLVQHLLILFFALKDHICVWHFTKVWVVFACFSKKKEF